VDYIDTSTMDFFQVLINIERSEASHGFREMIY